MRRYSVRKSLGGGPIIMAAGFPTVEEAADYIVREGNPYGWTLVAQEANQITATTPQLDLRPTEWERAARRGFVRPYDPEAVARPPRATDDG